MAAPSSCRFPLVRGQAAWTRLAAFELISSIAKPTIRQRLHPGRPTPFVIATMTWLCAALGLRIRPHAHTASMRRMPTSPVAASMPTSTKCALNVDCRKHPADLRTASDRSGAGQSALPGAYWRPDISPCLWRLGRSSSQPPGRGSRRTPPSWGPLSQCPPRAEGKLL
jgi:hypothetical protein